MTESIFIESQDQIDSILESIKWDHTFIKEAHLVSPTYVIPENGHVAVADANPDLFLLIVTGDSDKPVLELSFIAVEDMDIPCDVDIYPNAKVSHGIIDFFLISPGSWRIRAESLTVTFLDISAAKYGLRYGVDNPFTSQGFRKGTEKGRGPYS